MSETVKYPFDAQELMAEARRLTGIDLIDEQGVEPLTAYVNSLNAESHFHEQGLINHYQKTLRILCNRLRMQRDFLKHPEIADEPIEKPVFIMGMARSGTTKTQKVLSATGDFNWLPFWQAYNPSLISGDRTESPQQRIDEAAAYCDMFDRLSPETKLGHSFQTFEPEEDTVLTETCLAAPSLMGYARIPSYQDWLARQMPDQQYLFLRDAIKYLQWQGLASRDRRWLLKAPTYYGTEPFLLKVFPDARLVMTHRTPLQTVISSCKLLKLFHLPFVTDSPDYLMLLEGFKMMIEMHLKNRLDFPDMPMLDIRFEDVTRNMDGVLEQIYQHAGMPLTQQSLDNVKHWEAKNPMHKKGKFEYSFEEFGLTQALVAEKMSAYIDWLEA